MGGLREVRSRRLRKLILSKTMDRSFTVPREKAESEGTGVGRWINVEMVGRMRSCMSASIF